MCCGGGGGLGHDTLVLHDLLDVHLVQGLLEAPQHLTCRPNGRVPVLPGSSSPSNLGESMRGHPELGKHAILNGGAPILDILLEGVDDEGAAVGHKASEDLGVLLGRVSCSQLGVVAEGGCVGVQKHLQSGGPLGVVGIILCLLVRSLRVRDGQHGLGGNFPLGAAGVEVGQKRALLRDLPDAHQGPVQIASAAGLHDAEGLLDGPFPVCQRSLC